MTVTPMQVVARDLSKMAQQIYWDVMLLRLQLLQLRDSYEGIMNHF